MVQRLNCCHSVTRILHQKLLYEILSLNWHPTRKQNVRNIAVYYILNMFLLAGVLKRYMACQQLEC